MQINFEVNDQDLLKQLQDLTPRQFMIAWSGAVRRHIQKNAREKIGGDFGDLIARESIMTDQEDDNRHIIYAGGANGYIAEHIHTGGTIKPRTKAYLAIPIDRSVKGKYPREYGGELFVVRKKEDGPRGRAYLATTVGKRGKAKMLWVLKKSVYQRPRPWWPDEMEIEQATRKFFRENF